MAGLPGRPDLSAAGRRRGVGAVAVGPGEHGGDVGVGVVVGEDRPPEVGVVAGAVVAQVRGGGVDGVGGVVGRGWLGAAGRWGVRGGDGGEGGGQELHRAARTGGVRAGVYAG